MNSNQLSQIALAAPKGTVETFWPFIEGTMDKYEINTPLRQAHFLAQILHESGELKYREEIASGRAYEGRKDLGNIYKGDGRKFKGRGLIQLTGRTNYKLYGRSLGREAQILEHPELVADTDVLCVEVAGFFWNNAKLNQYADADNIKAITKRINGGTCGLANRIELLKRAKKVLGI